MNASLKRMTVEIKSDFAAKLADAAMAAAIAKTKDAGADMGTFNVIVSTEDKDRQGDIVKQGGWDLTFYKLNPVVLWAHDYGEPPIGVCTKIEVLNNQLVAEGKFAPHEFAQDIRKLYDLGMIKTTSVGFIPRQFDTNDNCVITEAELLEFSFVPVPANPYALSVRQVKELGLKIDILSTKGMKFDIKEGDAPAPEAPKVEPAPAVEIPPVAPVTETPKEEKADEPSPNEVRLYQAVKSAYEHLSNACNALKECVDSEGAKKALAGDVKAPTPKVENSSKDVDFEALNRFLNDRELMRSLNKALGQVLRKFNRLDRIPV